MADTFTTNYNFDKPQVGAQNNNWGNLLNADLDSIDTSLFAVSGVANAAMPKAGGTFTGDTTGTGHKISGAAATSRALTLQTATVNRWVLAANTTAEGGANAGSDLIVTRCTDAGAAIDNPITINRATGLVTLAQGLTVTGNLIVSGTLSGGYTIPAGSVTPAMLTTGHPSWDATGNFTASGGSAAALATTTTNTSTGAGVIARYALTTGTANSTVYLQLNDVSGAPTGQLVVGSAVASFAYDADTQIWRTTAGVEAMRLSSAGNFGIGTTAPLRSLHIGGANTAEASYTATNGLTNFRTWNWIVDGTAGIKANWALRLLSDDQMTAQWVAMLASGTTGVVNFPQGLTNNGVGLVLATDGRLTGLPLNSQASNYSVVSSDYGGCVHFTANATVTLPTAAIGTAYEISCDAGVTVTFSYVGTLRTVPANSTGAHTLVGPGSAFMEQKKAAEIWARGEIV